ncbi:hypothetical protein AAFM46_14770 [Arthrobacter sp. TMP15]|uniref:hypothetical protein n=1 Tax=Arthrobacter sp. TMP15 TaxID=3140789 RepID=UPI0031B9D412
MSDLLFGRLDTGMSTLFVAFRIVSALLMCAAIILLGRRNQLGWWLVAVAFLMPGLAELANIPGSSIRSPLALLLFVSSIAVPLALTIGVGIYGLVAFQKFPRDSELTRAITLRQYKPTNLVAPLLMAVVYTATSLIAVVSIYLSFSPSNLPVITMVVSGFLYGLLPAGMLGLARRSRWAWFLVASSAFVSLAGTVLAAQGSVLIFLFFAQACLAIYGWQRWGAIVSAPPPAKSVS